MMTQADVLASNEESYSSVPLKNQPVATYDNKPNQESINIENKIPKPVGFDAQFPELNNLNLNEHSPIRPSKYLASDSAINASKSLRRIIIGGMLFSLLVTFALIIQIFIGTTQVPNRIGIVTQEEACSKIGSDMVHKGGNSIDAFIASSLCLSVVNPFSSGLGAGGFLLVRDHKHEKNVAYNCYFKSSESLNLKNYETSPQKGKKSVAIPGELKCLQIAYHKYARFYWKTLAEPAVKLARYGFKVSKLLGEHLKDLDIEHDIRSSEIMSEMFLKDGKLVQEGDVITNPRLARTIELLTSREYIFYNDGEIGLEMVHELTDAETNQPQITMDDLKQYSVREETPMVTNYNDFVMLTANSPSNGPVLKFIIDLMKNLNVKIADVKSSSYFSHLLTASKMGYSMASYLGDPQFDTNQYETFNQKLTLAETYFTQNSTYPFEENIKNLDDDLVSNFIAVNDHNDMMVSYVGTLGSSWGSRIITKNGFFLNDALNLFSYDDKLKTDATNLINANKQPRGLITPILTYNKKNPCIRRLSVGYGHHGDMGKSDDYALTELTQVIVKVLTDFSLYESSVSDKRVQYSNQNSFCYENGFDAKIVDSLVKESNFKSSNSCMFHSIDLIMKKDHVIYGQADTSRSQDSLVLFN